MQQRRLSSEVKDRAIALLRYGIRTCKGKNFNAPVNVRLQILLNLQRTLHELQAYWHEKILSYWVHKYMQQHKGELRAFSLSKT